MLTQTLQSNHALAQAQAAAYARAPAPAPAFQGGRSKVREPDTFDGSTPSKLRAFEVQCHINFKDRPGVFANDEQKINYALSFLKGNALAWFETYIIEEREGYGAPTFFTDYREFCGILQSHFGPSDPTGAAQNDILSLSMKESQHISTYIVSFARLSAQLEFNDGALHCVFYSGLPDRIKDQMAFTDRPVTFEGLRNLAQSIDSRYWRRKTELTRTPARAANTNTHNPRSNPAPTKPAEPVKATAPKPATSTSKPTDLASKLGTDGKLTPAERTRRLANNLCLFCGLTGHRAAECPKVPTTAAKAKGRSAEVAEVPNDESSEPEETPAEPTA
jgi:hypothetical protein